MRVPILCAIAGTIASRSTPATVCNNTVLAQRVAAIADDGSFVFVTDLEGGASLPKVAVIGPDGHERASCSRFDEDPWQCTGDRTFKASSPHEKAETLAKRWSTQLKATDQMLPALVEHAPVGLIEAACSRMGPVFAGDAQFECGPDNATIVTSPRSALVFLRFQIGPVPDCGSQTTRDELSWFTRAELAQRLHTRSDLFKQRKRAELAARADEAAAWLTADPAPHGPDPFAGRH